MRFLSLIAVILLCPAVGSAQATVGDGAEESAMPDPEAPEDAAAADDADDDAPEPAGEVTFVPTPANVPRDREGTPIWESWWFWTAIAAVVLGITAAVVVDVTTDDPRPSSPEPDPDMMSMGLRLRF